jgi:PPOX class probable F420-dependent enzyme
MKPSHTEVLPEPIRHWARNRHQGVLITVRPDGSPQSSNVAFTLDGDVFRVSVTDDRAKTRNLRRDPRGVLHILGAAFGSYLSVSVTAAIGPPSRTPGDQISVELLQAYEQIAGPHPDRSEFFQAMVDERRLLLTLRPVEFSGWGPAVITPRHPGAGSAALCPRPRPYGDLGASIRRELPTIQE